MRKTREAAIVRKVLLGDVEAFALLVREYQGPVFSLMMRMVRDDEHAADLTQEAFIKAYERLDSFRLGRRFFPWLYSLSLNVARDWLRRQGRDRLVYVEDPSVHEGTAASGAQEAVADFMDGRKLFKTVESLDPKYGEALLLRFRYGLTMREIAQAMGITVSGAKMRVKRGLEMIRQAHWGES